MWNKWCGMRAVALLTIALSPLAAQRPGGGPPFGAGPAAQERHEFMAGYLGLSESQKEQAQQIFSGAQASAASMHGQMESARTELQNAIKANEPESRLEQLAAAIGALHGQGLAAQTKGRARFLSILSEEQRKKLESFERNTGDRGQRP